MLRMARLTVCCVALCLLNPSVFALNNRSAVSVNGSDADPCTVPSPCRTFTAALAATASGGEIIAIDSGGYGQSFTVSQPVTVSGAPGVHAAITATTGTAITINT